MFDIRFSAMVSEGFSGSIVYPTGYGDSGEEPKTVASFVFIRAKRSLQFFGSDGSGPTWTFHSASATNQAGLRGVGSWLQRNRMMGNAGV